MQNIKALITEIVDEDLPVHTLTEQVFELINKLKKLSNIEKLMNDYISLGETKTDNGLAISPTMAIMCADDYVRTVQFIRGLHAAIEEFNVQKIDRPARVLYAGTGPLAILAIPLMYIMNEEQATFVLLDLHQESIDSVNMLIETLHLDASVQEVVKIDAFDYEIDPLNPPDIIILEIMQACLAKEPQVAVSHHLITQAPHAILIPEDISIELQMIDSKNEFQFGVEKNERIRVELGKVLTINKEVLLSLNSDGSFNLPAITTKLPKDIPAHLDAKLFTKIITYKNHYLQDYDSGLTCPQSINYEGVIALGDTIEFTYELTKIPQLKVNIVH